MKPFHSFLDSFHQTCKSISIIFLIVVIPLTLFFINGCGLNPTPAPNVISGSDNLFAPKNGDATFIFSGGGNAYGSFELKAYAATAILMTPQGSGIQESSENLSTAPESGYRDSEECSYSYYYMITDMAPHYAKVLIHTIEWDYQNGITIDFNWWLQTEPGERNF